MTQEQVAERLSIAMAGVKYKGGLSAYAAKSIEQSVSNYPVANLIAYCVDMNLRIVMRDLATHDCFSPSSVLEMHKVLDLLMKRYNVDYKLVYRKTGVHYTAPKSFDEKELGKVKPAPNGKRYSTPLSIKTLLTVCDVIHCDLLFSLTDESSVII